MANTRQPPNVIRGIRSPIPPGYVLGRSDQGSGDPHLIKIGAGLVVKDRTLIAKASTNPADVDINGFGFAAGGLLTDKELLGIGVFGMNITFPSAVPSHTPIVTCAVGPAADATFNVVPLIAGIDQPSVCAIEFLAGATVASITWTPPVFTMLANQMFKVYGPSPADTDLWTIAAWIPGDI